MSKSNNSKKNRKYKDLGTISSFNIGYHPIHRRDPIGESGVTWVNMLLFFTEQSPVPISPTASIRK